MTIVQHEMIITDYQICVLKNCKEKDLQKK